MISGPLQHSALASGRVTAAGPRYRPSIETKIVRFPDRSQHSVFRELEGWDTKEVHIQGTSNSLSADVQLAMPRSVPGLQRAEMTRPSYAIEYNFVRPSSLLPTLECRDLPALYLAGQINGTSGYEKAAAQGLVAVANAAVACPGRPWLVLARHEAYIGVLIDDLVNRHADEPYGLLTSRAEHRLQLSQDSAYARLAPKAHESGLVSRQRAEGVQRELTMVEAAIGHGASRLEGTGRAAALQEQDTRYAGYRQRSADLLARATHRSDLPLPRATDLDRVPIKEEVRARIRADRPRTIRDALTLPGITPADAATLAAYVLRRQGRVSRET